MIGLRFEPDVGRVLCLGAHPDDIEVGAGALVSHLADSNPHARFTFAIASGDDSRRLEAEQSAHDLLGDRVTLIFGKMTDGVLPYEHAAEAKSFFRDAASGDDPDLVLAPHRADRHQDHRFVADLAHQLMRRHLILEYEIVKLEGDLGRPNVYLPLTGSQVESKLDHLERHFPSQHGKIWYDRQTFGGLMRIRGIEGLAPDGYAEAFHATRIAVT